MAVWRIISRSCLKYASNPLTKRNSTKICLATSLTRAVKQTKLSPFHIPNSDIYTGPSDNIFQNLRFYSVQTRKKQEEDESDGPRLNDKITGDYVRLVSEEGHTVVSLKEALRRAKELECDLVEVQRDATPPVCKIVKYSLEKYKKAKVGKERAKAKRAEAIRSEVKEIRFTPKIDAKDLKFKADHALKLMESGYRVKCNAVPDKDKHKELEPEKLLELLSRFTCYIEDAIVEFGPEADKGSAVVIVRHAKFGPPKKGGVKKLKDMNIKTAAKIKGETPKLDDTSEEAGASTFDDQGVVEKPEPELSAKQTKPVQGQNRYAEREPRSESSGGRDANRFEQRSVNPQRPLFPNQAPERFDPQSPNQAPSAPRPRLPNQQPTSTGRFDPQSPNQAPRTRFQNQQPNERFDRPSPSPPRPRFPDQAPNQQHSGPSPPPRFQNQAPNQQPNGRFDPPQPPNPPPQAPPRPQTRLPNETPNQQPTSPASGYGIFSTPKAK